ncbi:YhcN/YlaJ family sporulation lipoprotein [Cytobacillus sp. IB215665]|uniref:YhcN/YlaJ family sporulation lipoprotein n=1 Tax=Cytobacillus sp. IB215665 TaxID=3097357 RepID=UPI002A0AF7D8|nr:YhcN/YlaJ family sporulation lipoprotein [Cytobacillus sp. IB215665]MDX8366892.1 YhcN/YlaJ family sporulation lipoprotein [Cytobacillus sp. IB215665]
MKQLKLFSVAMLSVPLLFACNTAPNEEAIDVRDNNTLRNVTYNENRAVRRNIAYEGNLANRNVTYDRMRVNNANNRTNTANETRMEVAQDAADRITAMKEVRRANVIVTNNNAYVAATLNNNTTGTTTKKLESRIADKVRAQDKNIDNVYVSTNPDFINRMTDYGNRINRGEPVEGFFTDFNETVRRVFPTAR